MSFQLSFELRASESRGQGVKWSNGGLRTNQIAEIRYQNAEVQEEGRRQREIVAGADETNSYHSSETALRLICLWLGALGLRLATDTPAWGITPHVVQEVIQTVVSYIVVRAVSYIVRTVVSYMVRRAIRGAAYIVVSYIVCRIVSAVTARSPSSVV